VRQWQGQHREELQYKFDQQNLGGLNLQTPDLFTAVAFPERMLSLPSRVGAKFYLTRLFAAKADLPRQTA